jgi:hypothetical protein
METTKQVNLIGHTSCGLEFEIVDAVTGKSLTGRMFWCTDEDMEEDDEIESRGWEHFRKKIENKGWAIREIVWS